MIRYIYNTQKQPPPPFVLVTLKNPIDGAEGQDVPAQVDTAADRTLVPLPILDALGLTPIGSLMIGGVGGTMEEMAVYAISLTISTQPEELGNGRSIGSLQAPFPGVSAAERVWTLMPSRIREYAKSHENLGDFTLAKELMELEPDFGKKRAYAELPLLIAHMRRQLGSIRATSGDSMVAVAFEV